MRGTQVELYSCLAVFRRMAVPPHGIVIVTVYGWRENKEREDLLLHHRLFGGQRFRKYTAASRYDCHLRSEHRHLEILRHGRQGQLWRFCNSPPSLVGWTPRGEDELVLFSRVMQDQINALHDIPGCGRFQEVFVDVMFSRATR